MPHCSVVECYYKDSSEDAKSKGFKYQSFPLPKENLKLRELWLKKLNRAGPNGGKFEPYDDIYICHRHFTEEAFISAEDNKTTRGKPKKTRALKPLSYPTLCLRPVKAANPRKTETSAKARVTDILFNNPENEAANEPIIEAPTVANIHEYLAGNEDIERNNDQNESNVSQISIEHDHSYQEKNPKVCVQLGNF